MTQVNIANNTILALDALATSKGYHLDKKGKMWRVSTLDPLVTHFANANAGKVREWLNKQDDTNGKDASFARVSANTQTPPKAIETAQTPATALVVITPETAQAKPTAQAIIEAIRNDNETKARALAPLSHVSNETKAKALDDVTQAKEAGDLEHAPYETACTVCDAYGVKEGETCACEKCKGVGFILTPRGVGIQRASLDIFAFIAWHATTDEATALVARWNEYRDMRAAHDKTIKELSKAQAAQAKAEAKAQKAEQSQAKAEAKANAKADKKRQQLLTFASKKKWTPSECAELARYVSLGLDCDKARLMVAAGVSAVATLATIKAMYDAAIAQAATPNAVATVA